MDYLTASPWTGRRFIAVLLAWLVGGIVGGVVAFAARLDPSEEPLGLAITIVVQSAGALWVVVSVSRGSGSGDLGRDVGLQLKGKDAVGLLWGFGLQIAVALLLSPLVRVISDDFDTQPQVADLAEETSDIGGRLVLIVMFVLVAPFVEELIFRGVMLSWLARQMPVGGAVVVSAGAFAGVHLADPNAALAVPSLFVIGVVLGWAAQWRRSLSLPIFMHAGVNLLGAVLLMWGDEIVDHLERTRDGLESFAVLVGLG